MITWLKKNWQWIFFPVGLFIFALAVFSQKSKPEDDEIIEVAMRRMNQQAADRETNRKREAAEYRERLGKMTPEQQAKEADDVIDKLRRGE